MSVVADAVDRVLRGAGAIVFDVGETLVDETRAWTEAAGAVGSTPFTLMGLLGALIERGEDHRGVWELLGVDPPPSPSITAGDLYPDAIPCLAAARSAGLAVGIAGNQPAGAEEQLRAAQVHVDFVAASARWGVAKPSAEFFTRVLEEARVPADRIVHVGDRLDNDVLPARAAGMRTVLIRRGPWGHVHATRPEAALADCRIDSLDGLTRALERRTSNSVL